MAKLSHKITSNDNNNNQSNNNKLNFSLSTKVDNGNDTTYNGTQTNNEQQNNIEQQKPIEIPQGKSDFLKFLYENISFENFGKINKQTIDEIFSAEEQISEEQATKKIISHLISNNVIEQISKYIEDINTKTKELTAKVVELEERSKKQDIQVKNLSAQIDDADEQVFKIEKKYSTSIAIEDLINDFVTSKITTENTRSIASLLIDSYKNGGKQETKFVLGFIKGFLSVQDAIMSIGEDEKVNIELLHNSSRKLMEEISDTTSAERRPILDKVANLYNGYLNEYDFISPEQTLQIDPTIHNAEGLGGTIIKEGLSFAVVRRETRKAVFYAEIKTK